MKTTNVIPTHAACSIFTCLLMLGSFFGTFQLSAQEKNIDEEWRKNAIESIEKSQYFFSSLNKSEQVAINKASAFRTKIKPLEQQFESISASNAFDYNLKLVSIHKGIYYVQLNDVPEYKSHEGNLKERHNDFDIEYLNNEKGLKQNFILSKKIQGSHKLILEIGFDSDNSYPVLQNNEIKIFNKLSKTEVASYNGLYVYDKNNEVVPSTFKISNTTILIEVNDIDAVYPLTIDPISNTPSVLVIAAVANAQLGYCVSGAGDVNGDGFSDVIVGAPKYANGQTNEGAIFIYHGSANGIGASPNTTIEGNIALPASFTPGTDFYFTSVLGFGTSVSEAGDVNGDGFGDVIVGHPYLSNGNNGEGKAFVYHGSAAGIANGAAPSWTYENNIDSSHVGFSVSSAGDVNNDGFSDVIIGAPRRSNGQRFEGMAYIFHGSGTGLAAAPTTTIEENNANSWLGWSVSVAGDVNGDTYDDVVVTAVYYDGGQTNEGKAFVYHGSATGINTVAAWSAEANQIEAYYGENASWAGDVNGDGYGDLIVGADYYDNGTTDEGRTYIYHGSVTGLGAAAALTLEIDTISNFGVGVNGAGDVNGDGFGDIVIGAYSYAKGQANEGATYVYYGSSTGIVAASKTTIQSNKANTALGISVAGCGDVNGDGFSDIISGAYLYDRVTPSALTNCGAFYIFNGRPESIGTVSIPASPYTLSEANAGLGNFVTTIGDVNADGFADMAVGASLFNNGGTDRGVVYVFHGSSTGFPATPTTTINGPLSNNAQFGTSIGAAGDVNGDGYSDIIVGAPFYANGQALEGYFAIYLGSASGINTTAHLAVESNLANGQIGYSVAGAGDVNGDGYSDVIVGGNTYNSGTVNEGKVFVYHGSSTGVDATADWTYETNVAEKLGVCVAGVGDCNGDGYSDIVALSSDWTSGQTNEGHIFYFRGSSTGLETGPGSILETNVANAGLDRQSTSYMGDVNGDGYNDVVIGVSSFNNGATANEGELMVIYGTFPSLYFSTTQIIEGNATGFYLGNTVGFGGDVNGDGYNDIITGSPAFANGQATEGIVRVYAGGPGTSISTTPYFSKESNIASTSMGSSVSSGGDANADGFADIVIGANGYDAGATLNVGRVFCYMGNNSHGVLGKSWVTQQFKSTFAQVVQSSNGTFEIGCGFGVKHFDKHHLGKGRGKQVWEYKGHPHPFNNYAAAMANSVTFSGLEPAFTDLGLTGNTMSPTINASSMGFPKWRTRTKFHIIDALDGQMHGRWIYGGINDKQDRSIKINITCGVLPVELLSVNVSCIDNKSHMLFSVMEQENIALYNIYGSVNGIDFSVISSFTPGIKNDYQIEIPDDRNFNYVRLEIIDNNNNTNVYDKKKLGCYESENELMLFPNPAAHSLNLKLETQEDQLEEVKIVDLAGRTVHKVSKYYGSIDISMLPPGIYYVVAATSENKVYTKKFSHL